jgi:hypothetical protein
MSFDLLWYWSDEEDPYTYDMDDGYPAWTEKATRSGS